jgi:hypothetical protein
MTGNSRSFCAGAAAFRNLRDWAEEQRNGAIELANERLERVDHGVVEEVGNEDLQANSLGATFSFTCGISNSTAGALVNEQESDTSLDDAYVPPSAKWARLRHSV